MDVFQFVVIATLFLATVLSFTMAILAWRRRPLVGMLPFALLMLAVGIWSASYLFELVAIGLEAKNFWVNVQYVGISLAPSFWFIFAYQYSGLDQRRLNRFLLAFLFGLPLVTIVLSWTNSYHHWMRSDIHLTGPGFFWRNGKGMGALVLDPGSVQLSRPQRGRLSLAARFAAAAPHVPAPAAAPGVRGRLTLGGEHPLSGGSGAGLRPIAPVFQPVRGAAGMGLFPLAADRPAASGARGGAGEP